MCLYNCVIKLGAKMKILFVHRGFPGQFKYLAAALTLDPNNEIFFLTEDEIGSINGVNKIVHKVKTGTHEAYNSYSKNYDIAIERALETAEQAEILKNNGFKPDIIYGFSGWGSSMFIKDVFPDVPFICYCEWYLNPEGAHLGFDGTKLGLKERAKLRCDNAHVLTTLALCDGGISPTHWQKSQFPKEFQDKISVVHDGVDVGLFEPNKDVKFIIKDKNIELTTKDEVITYGTRGLEPTRGFPQFMEAVAKLLKKRPKAHFIIAGEDIVCYSHKTTGTYKKQMLKQFDIDLNRVHFVGTLPYNDYAKFLQVSSCHVYLTYPFVLSWSILDALSTGCLVVGSNTAPVTEVIEDNFNGLLAEFFNVNQLVEKIEYALENKDRMEEIRKNARQSMLDKYDLIRTVPQQIRFLQGFIK